MDLPNKRARVISKGGAIEWIHWQTGTALLLPRLLAGRTQGLVFLTDRHGNIEAGLTARLLSFIRLLRDTSAGRVIGGLIARAQSDVELAAAYRRLYSGPRRTLAVRAFIRAQQRGHPTGCRSAGRCRSAVGAGHHRLLLPDRPLTDQFAVALVDNLVLGLRPSH